MVKRRVARKRGRQQGRLIVIDGIDGSGKATQVALLERRLKKLGIPVRTIAFPRYEKNFFGTLIAECLRGERGDFLSLDPRIASVLYAADRFESRSQLEAWLQSGYVVIADRYVTSNQIHQGAKIAHVRHARTFLEWLDTLEYHIFKLPRPDAVVYLDIPSHVSWKLLKGTMRKKRYLRGRKDTAEADRNHQELARRNALRIVRSHNRWHTVSCMKDGALQTPDEIHELVFATVRHYVSHLI